MRGLEPRTPFMRSNKTDFSNACAIRDFGSLSSFLPIVLPTSGTLEELFHGGPSLIPKVLGDLNVEVLRRTDIGVPEESLRAPWGLGLTRPTSLLPALVACGT